MKTDDYSVIRLRVDPEFKEEVEALAKSKQINMSALTRQLLAEAVAAHKAKQADQSAGKEAA